MKININGIEYDVVIIKKNNKNTYIRLKDNNTIQVTTSYCTTKKSIIKLINDNSDYIRKVTKKINDKKNKENDFYYLGKKYDVIVVNTKQIEFDNDKVYVPSINNLEKYINKNMKEIFLERLDYWYDIFEENIPYPNLKIRKMKTRWGVCNRKSITVTLNSELIKYNIRCLDYVIVHELSHFVHFDHSKDFWKLVSKYYPDYKSIRKELRD